MSERITNSIKSAAEKLRPSKAGWTIGETDIGENRRDGCTTVDKRLGALRIADSETDIPVAVLLRVTAHPNILMCGDSLISSDYFGLARNKLRQYFNCPSMLIQGAAGNVKPSGVDKIRGGSVFDADRIAERLLNSAKTLRFDMSDVTELAMFERDIDYCSDVPSEEEANKIAGDANSLFGIDGEMWLAECERLRQAGVSTQIQSGKVHFFRLNEACICGVADEIFCEISLEASKRTRSPYLFLNGYTNGCTGYLPHSEEWVKGGYETLYSYLQFFPFHGHVMPFRRDTADRIVDLVCDAVF